MKKIYKRLLSILLVAFILIVVVNQIAKKTGNEGLY